eukprot:353445-Chlamydomonas_euryale.AAC.20
MGDQEDGTGNQTRDGEEAAKNIDGKQGQGQRPPPHKAPPSHKQKTNTRHGGYSRFGPKQGHGH